MTESKNQMIFIGSYPGSLLSFITKFGLLKSAHTLYLFTLFYVSQSELKLLSNPCRLMPSKSNLELTPVLNRMSCCSTFHWCVWCYWCLLACKSMRMTSTSTNSDNLASSFQLFSFSCSSDTFELRSQALPPYTLFDVFCFSYSSSSTSNDSDDVTSPQFLQVRAVPPTPIPLNSIALHSSLIFWNLDWRWCLYWMGWGVLLPKFNSWCFFCFSYSSSSTSDNSDHLTSEQRHRLLTSSSLSSSSHDVSQSPKKSSLRRYWTECRATNIYSVCCFFFLFLLR